MIVPALTAALAGCGPPPPPPTVSVYERYEQLKDTPRLKAAAAEPARDGFTAAFLIQCMAAIGTTTLRLGD